MLEASGKTMFTGVGQFGEGDTRLPVVVDKLPTNKIKAISLGWKDGTALLCCYCYYLLLLHQPANGTMISWTSGSNSSITNVPVAEKNQRIVMISCGDHHFGAKVVPAFPSWAELKPLLVGWKKEVNCCFFNEKGVPLHILQLIIEMAWACDLPSPLVVPN